MCKNVHTKLASEDVTMRNKHVTMIKIGIALIFAFIALGSSSALAESTEVIENNTAVRDVEESFNNLAQQGEWLGYYLDDHEHSETGEQFELFPGSNKAHTQGVARSPRTDIPPVFYVAVSDGGFHDDAYAGIMVVEMKSLDTNGERVSSNRLDKNNDTIFTLPPEDDKVLNIIETKSHHPSGMAMVGDILAVPMSGFVHFYDCRNATAPVRLEYALPLIGPNAESTGANAVAITKLPDGRFLLVTDTDKGAHFYWSYDDKTSFFNGDENATDIFHKSVLSSNPDDLIGANDTNSKIKLNEEENEERLHMVEDSQYKLINKSECRATGYWPFKSDYHKHDSSLFQGMGFVNQVDENGVESLYIIGLSNSHEYTPESSRTLHEGVWYDTKGRDEIYLLEVVNPESPDTIGLRGVDKAVKTTRSPQAGDDNYQAENCVWQYKDIFGTWWYTYTYPKYTKRWQGNFNSAAGSYVSPTGELLVYGVSHFADGELSKNANYFQYTRRDDYREKDFVKMAEYGHKYISSEEICGPVFRENNFGGPHTVNEGTSLTISGEVQVIEPWVRMFQNEDYTGESVLMEWDKQGDEDYNKFSLLDGDDGFNDIMSSFFWNGPPGSALTFYVNEEHGGELMGPFNGSGEVESKVLNGDLRLFDDNISSVKIEWNPSSTNYFVDWDDNTPTEEGPSLETESLTFTHNYGDNGVFAVEIGVIDGENTVYGTETVTVLNVDPVINTAILSDETGAIIGIDVPVILEGIRTNITATFHDAGNMDTHTSNISWDGVQAVNAFVDEQPYGPPGSTEGMDGNISSNHTYSEKGNYTITLAVTDDDSGQGTMIVPPVRVVDAEEAIEIVIDDLLAHMPDTNISMALDKLRGDNEGVDENGAIDRLEQELPNAGIEKILQSIKYIEAAEEDQNIDLSSTKNLLSLAAKSVAVQAIAEAENNPKLIKKVQKAKELVSEGDELLAIKEHSGAIGYYQEAARTV